MDDKTKQDIEQDVIDGDREWEEYLEKIEADSMGLTVEQYRHFETLHGDEAREYFEKHTTRSGGR